MPERINENFNVNFNTTIGAQGTESLDTQEIQGTSDVNGAQDAKNTTGTAKTSDETSENDLVTLAYDDNASGLETENNVLDEIQNERTEALDKYLQYQEQMAELQRQKSEYESEMRLHNDNPDTVKRLQGKLEALEVEISDLKENMAECQELMQSLMVEFNTALTNMINQNTAQSLQMDVPMTYSGGANAINTASYGVSSGGVSNTGRVSGVNGTSNAAIASGGGVPAANYGTYTGDGIPANVASALDARLGAGFSEKCESVAGYLGCNVNDLLAMMYSESGLKTTARNKSSNAVGLIQFIPSTLKGNGYTTEQVASMNALQQLDVVADIFMKSKKMAGYDANEKIDGGTLYAINWLPAYAKRDVIVSNGEKYYSSGLDMNKDGSVTKADLTQRLQSKYNEMLRAI